MKLKNIFKYLMLAFLTLYLGSCSNNTDADQLFDQTPTERLNAQKSELNDALLASENGWKAVYFTDDTQLGGYTHLFKFLPGNKVEMASDFDDDTEKYTSDYNVVLGSTVSLLFDTYNRIHLLSDSNSYPTTALRGKGYLGDFQFLYYGQENGDILFKSNRLVREVRFVKATAQDWVDLAENLETEKNVIGSSSRPLFRFLETNDGTTVKKYDFSFSSATRFSNSSAIDDSGEVISMGVGYTPTGIVVSPAVEVKGQKLTNFIYNDADGSFTATGTGGVTATIKYSNEPLVLTDDYKLLLEGNPQMVFGYIDANLYTAPSTSSYAKSLIDKVNATLPATQKLARIQFYFNTALNGSYIEYRFNGGKASIYHFIITSEDATKKTLILSNDGWTVAAASRAFLNELDAELTNPQGLYVKKEAFRITYTNTVYTFTSAASNFRITTYQL
ncbi:DUF4302 domain-containing protein [Flavobacterium sp. W22_SRS_FK3]|uniref:DUF4302 domain-containing protein n=1 Tax=Flavobacterium sp. W22_SRS_FK3 TaxID=3240275 RepID=UPI003F902785